MTDVLPGVNSFMDDELTSTAETKPKAAAPAPKVTQCRYCTETFEGGFGAARRGQHEKKVHHEDWLKSKATGSKPKSRKAAAAKNPAAPKAAKSPTDTKSKRIKAGDGISMVLSGLAQMVVKVDGPVGRALIFSAPATGDAVDELVAGTFVDKKVLQPFAGAADKWEKVGGIIAFPVLIAVISRNPALFNPLEEQLRAATVDVINAAVPSLEKKKQREKKAADSLGRLGAIDPRYADSDDPIKLILEDIFGAKIMSPGDDVPPE